MKVIAIILFVLAVVTGIGALSKMSIDDSQTAAYTAGRMIGTLMFPVILAAIGVVLWKKAGRAEQSM
jgi:hypothetical protein